MAPGIEDRRMASVQPRLKYNTVGGVNGPLVILDNVSSQTRRHPDMLDGRYTDETGYNTRYRSNSPDTMRLYRLRCPTDLNDLVRCWKLEVGVAGPEAAIQLEHMLTCPPTTRKQSCRPGQHVDLRLDISQMLIRCGFTGVRGYHRR